MLAGGDLTPLQRRRKERQDRLAAGANKGVSVKAEASGASAADAKLGVSGVNTEVCMGAGAVGDAWAGVGS